MKWPLGPPLSEMTEDQLRLRGIMLNDKMMECELRLKALKEAKSQVTREMMIRNGWVEVERGMWVLKEPT